MPILQVRDKDGNFIPIPAIKGDEGKSAYEQAKEGGYKGTEEEFVAILNGLTFPKDTEHRNNFDNPHKVTKEQLGLGNVDNVSLNAHIANTENPHNVTKKQLGLSDIDLSSGIKIGGGAKCDEVQSIAIGYGANINATRAIQLGEGTNGEPRTLQVFDYQLLDKDGIIPSDRLPIVTGTYTGNGTESRTINLGVTPKAVFVNTEVGGTLIKEGASYHYYGGLAVNGSPVLNYERKKVIEICDGGFIVAYDISNTNFWLASNMSGQYYNYIAFI